VANIFDYLDWRGDLTFGQSPLNEVDAYILCKLGCPDFTGIIPADGAVTVTEAADRYFGAHGDGAINLGLFISPYVVPMIRRLPGTARFGTLRVGGFVNIVDPDRDEQFSALTVTLPDGTRVVTFRGTDDTIVAWKEDFLISVEDIIPAQKHAESYLAREAARGPGPLIVGGHSKGGNLAVYAALRAAPEVQDRILTVYNFDGPGFRQDLSRTPEYARIRQKLHTVVSQHAMVGMLLHHENDCTIVKSDQIGMAAHDGFRWEVLGTQFVRCPDYSIGSKAFETAISDIAGRMDTEKRMAFIDELFSVLTSTGAVTLSDLTAHRLRQAAEIAQRMRKSPEVRSFIETLTALMVRETLTNVRGAVPVPRIRVAGNGKKGRSGRPGTASQPDVAAGNTEEGGL
jgi:hypothetical protein